VFQVLLDIWSRGCNPQLYYALPVLFSLEVVGLVLGAMGVYRRCHYAVIVEEAQEAAFKDRVAVAIAAEKKIAEERRQNAAEGSEDAAAEEKREEEVLGGVIRKEDKELQKRSSRAAAECNYGPTFSLAFSNNQDGSSEDVNGEEV
jgi:hypothetical protein